jgi:hypothetical protein
VPLPLTTPGDRCPHLRAPRGHVFDISSHRHSHGRIPSPVYAEIVLTSPKPSLAEIGRTVKTSYPQFSETSLKFRNLLRQLWSKGYSSSEEKGSGRRSNRIAWNQQPCPLWVISRHLQCKKAQSGRPETQSVQSPTFNRGKRSKLCSLCANKRTSSAGCEACPPRPNADIVRSKLGSLVNQ